MDVVWLWIAEPLLFTTIGSSLKLSDLPSGTIGKSVTIVVSGETICRAGMCSRVPQQRGAAGSSKVQQGSPAAGCPARQLAINMPS